MYVQLVIGSSHSFGRIISTASGVLVLALLAGRGMLELHAGAWKFGCISDVFTAQVAKCVSCWCVAMRLRAQQVGVFLARYQRIYFIKISMRGYQRIYYVLLRYRWEDIKGYIILRYLCSMKLVHLDNEHIFSTAQWGLHVMAFSVWRSRSTLELWLGSLQYSKAGKPNQTWLKIRGNLI